ncbi:hypothetical protein FA95DRAFT_1605063 [Auriscalpium vulgare]|uniref:Uncharacterized protein n=1 Tax=Auriscalpium vulgare TaxID=40419 RepID=A0ACB8RYL6_9AGAM|nr:hypothetical protein FA95DRAFT_1605063 [Auriscalpium vulgare]
MRTPQLKNLELSRLPKLPKAARSVNFKRTTPGSSAILASHGARQERHEMLDPAHPAAHLPLIARQKLCPRWLANSKLKLYGFPKAFLTKPAVRYSDPPFPLQPFPESGLPTRRRPNVALGFVLMRNDVKLDAPLRFKIKRRIRAAAELIISRGAHAVEVPGGGWRVEFDARDAGAKRWLVPDWCYVARPTNEMYRTSLAETVHLLRQGMQLIRDRALKLEATDSTLRASRATAGLRMNIATHPVARPKNQINSFLGNSSANILPFEERPLLSIKTGRAMIAGQRAVSAGLPPHLRNASAASQLPDVLHGALTQCMAKLCITCNAFVLSRDSGTNPDQVAGARLYPPIDHRSRSVEYTD